MASYQIPQFLDSGDKILLSLNMRQFGYALGGFFLSVAIFTLMRPALGNYAIIPILPILAITAYLAFGKYNGRDSEVYVLKAIIYFSKPRSMTYTRIPEVQDLNKKLSEWNQDKIVTRWKEAASTQKKVKSDQYADFHQVEAEEKAKRIRNLGTNVDKNLTNTLDKVQGLQLAKSSKEGLLNSLQNSRRSRVANQNPTLPPIPSAQPTADTNPLMKENYFKSGSSE